MHAHARYRPVSRTGNNVKLRLLWYRIGLLLSLGFCTLFAFSPIIFLRILFRRVNKNHNPHVGDSPQESRRERLRQIEQMCRARGFESARPTLLVGAARSLGIRPSDPPPSNLSDPALSLDFFGRALEYAASPHKSEHHVTLGPDIGTKDQA